MDDCDRRGNNNNKRTPNFFPVQSHKPKKNISRGIRKLYLLDVPLHVARPAAIRRRHNRSRNRPSSFNLSAPHKRNQNPPAAVSQTRPPNR